LIKKHNGERKEEYHKFFRKNRKEKICIFCAGNNGKRLYVDLVCNDVHPDFFSDNYILNSVETLLGSVACISWPELEKQKNETLVIIANAEPNEIYTQLKKAQFPYIITQFELELCLQGG